MASFKLLAGAMIGVLLLGCVPPSEVATPFDQWGDKVILEEQPSGGLFLVIREKRPSFQTLFLRELDWERAEAQLTNADATVPTLNRTVDASRDAANARRATVSFTAIKPTSGYTLTIRLKRRNRDGVYETLASGSNAGFTVSPGANAVTVALTATSQGELLVDVSKPSLGLNTLTSEVVTQSAFSVERVAGDEIGGTTLGTSPTSAAFREVSGLEVDSAGTVYLADAGNHQLRRVPTSGATTILAGSASGTAGFGGDGDVGGNALLDTPRGLTRDPVTGNLYFCDAGNDRVRSLVGGQVYTVAGGGTDTGDTVSYGLNAQLDEPFGIAADQNGNVFVTERGSGRVRRLDPTGSVSTLATLTPGAVGPIAIDRTRELLWVGDGGTVRAITGINGSTPTVAASTVFTASGASSPVVTGLTFDQVGTLYVAQSGNEGGLVGRADARIWRLAVTTSGQLQSGRTAEAIAGTGGTAPSAVAYSVPTAPVANATTQLLAGKNWCGLFIDMSAGLSGTTVSGHLYCSNSYDGLWGQVLRLNPLAL